MFSSFSLNKNIKKLKQELVELENEAVRQREDLKHSLEAEFKIKIDKVQNEKEDGMTQLKRDLDETNLNLESSRKSHREEILLIENSKQQSLALAHQEQRVLSERLNETLNNMEEVNRELERHRREASSRLEKDRSSISDLQIEVRFICYFMFQA